MKHNWVQYKGNDCSCNQRDLARNTKLPGLRSRELGKVYPVQTKISKNAQINVQKFTYTKKRTQSKEKTSQCCDLSLKPKKYSCIFFDFMDRH